MQVMRGRTCYNASDGGVDERLDTLQVVEGDRQTYYNEDNEGDRQSCYNAGNGGETCYNAGNKGGQTCYYVYIRLNYISIGDVYLNVVDLSDLGHCRPGEVPVARCCLLPWGRLLCACI